MSILVALLIAAVVGLVAWLILKLLPFIEEGYRNVIALVIFIIAFLVQLGFVNL